MGIKFNPPITDSDDPRLKPHWTMEPLFLLKVIYLETTLLLIVFFGKYLVADF